MKLRWNSFAWATWRVGASLLVFFGIAELGKRVSELDSGRQVPPIDGAKAAPATPAAPALDVQQHDFSLWPYSGQSDSGQSDIPVATSRRIVEFCDVRTWSPRDLAEWTSGSWLVDLERQPDRVTAFWLSLDGISDSMDLEASGPNPGKTTVHHRAELSCSAEGAGILHHSWIRADESLTRLITAPDGKSLVTEQSNPIPVLAGSVRQLQFDSLGWRIFVDRLASAGLVLPRFEAAMAARGWQRQQIALPVSGTARRPSEDIVLRREEAVCLVSRCQINGHEMLITACLGLPAKKSTSAPITTTVREQDVQAGGWRLATDE